VPIAHLAQIGALAGRALYVEAQTHMAVLVKLGLSGAVLVEFEKTLDELDAGRGAHSPRHNAQ
jgi:hypothetical protein